VFHLVPIGDWKLKRKKPLQRALSLRQWGSCRDFRRHCQSMNYDFDLLLLLKRKRLGQPEDAVLVRRFCGDGQVSDLSRKWHLVKLYHSGWNH
jgi:hypothetical protein